MYRGAGRDLKQLSKPSMPLGSALLWYRQKNIMAVKTRKISFELHTDLWSTLICLLRKASFYFHNLSHEQVDSYRRLQRTLCTVTRNMSSDPTLTFPSNTTWWRSPAIRVAVGFAIISNPRGKPFGKTNRQPQISPLCQCTDSSYYIFFFLRQRSLSCFSTGPYWSN